MSQRGVPRMEISVVELDSYQRWQSHRHNCLNLPFKQQKINNVYSDLYFLFIMDCISVEHISSLQQAVDRQANLTHAKITSAARQTKILLADTLRSYQLTLRSTHYFGSTIHPQDQPINQHYLKQALFDAANQIRVQIQGHDFCELQPPKLTLPFNIGSKLMAVKEFEKSMKTSIEVSEQVKKKIQLAYAGVLDLSGMNLVDNQLPEILKLAAERGIVSLKLMKNGITDDGVRMILEKLPGVESLNLNTNKLTSKSLYMIEQEIRKGCKLRWICLSKNKIKQFKQKHREVMFQEQGVKLFL